MKILSKNHIITLHKQLVSQFGGLDAIRDEGLLDSAIQAPFQTFRGMELYPTLLSKAARLCYGLIKNHPFVDGNKRIGTHSMLVFLALNGITLKYQDDELLNLILDISSGNKDESYLLQWLALHLT